MKERGSALLTAVIIIMVLLSISGIFFTTLIYQAKNESSEEKGLKAYYLAEAGVQYGIAEIWEGTLVNGVPFQQENPFGQGGKFVVTVTKGDTTYTVESTGYYGSDTERKIKVSYKYTAGGGGDGSEDDNTPPEYPPWTPQVYGTPGTLVNSVDSEGYVKVFYNVWYAHSNEVPGEGTAPPWQEITIQWTAFNRYYLNDIVSYKNAKFLHRWDGSNTNGEPGALDKHGSPTNEWQELTNEWRNLNTYNSGDLILNSDGKLFRARDYSFNQAPGLFDSPWQELTQDWRSCNIYDPSKSELYNEVVYNGKRYRAKWYTKNDIPGSANVWELIPNSQITPPVFLGVIVTPATDSIQVGQTKSAFTAKAVYSDGSTADVTNTAVWSSADPSTVQMASGGVATGVKTGFWTGYFDNNKDVFIPVNTPNPIPIPITIRITASYGGKVGTAYMTVSANSGGGTAAEGFLWEKEIE